MELSSVLFSKYIEGYINFLKFERNLSQNTIDAYSFDLNHLSSFLEKQVSNNENGLNSLWQYFDYLINEKKLKDTTIKRKFISIKIFLNYLVSRGILEESPLKYKNKSFKTAKRLPKTLSKQEVKNLLEAPRKELNELFSLYRRNICYRNIAILELIFCTGIRIGELVAINIEDLNLEDAILLILGKGRKERMLYISSDEVISVLHNWLSIRPFFHPQSNALFLNRFGERLTIFSIENIFYKYRDLSNISPKSTPHFLRHSFATELLNNGADIRVVQEILGHSSISTTEIYTEVSTRKKKETLSKFNPRNDL